MTAALGNFVNGAFNTLDGFVYPQFLFDPMRAPTTNDIFPAGTRWLDNSVNPKVIYVTTGAGIWNSANSVTGNLVTSGSITATNGNLTLGTAGNKLNIATGTNASVGKSAAMTAGSITISTTAVTASSIIFLTHANIGGTVGELSVGTIVAGTSFVINSSSGSDTSTVNWLIIN